MTHRITAARRALAACGLVLGLALALPAASVAAPAPAATPDGQHDFDFEFGSWKTHLKRLLHPLSGSTTWVELDGTSVVRTVWGGRANLGEFKADNATSHIQGMSLRLYNPETRQWSLYWVNAADGGMTLPLVGGFKGGRGEFLNHDTLNGKPIMARFIISDLAADTFRLEQAFSPDEGKTWEVNWIATFTREQA
jgi:hypothetical protein